MANPVKGEVGFEALGEKWTVVGGFLAICQIEEEFGQPAGLALSSIFPEASPATLADPALAAEAAKSVSAVDIARVFKSLLAFQHPDIDDRTARMIVNEIEPEGALQIIKRAMERSAAPASGGAGDANPPKRPSRAR